MWIPGSGTNIRHLRTLAAILAGGMTVAGIQGQRIRTALRKIVPTVERHWTQLYDLEENLRAGSGPNQAYVIGLSRFVREQMSR